MQYKDFANKKNYRKPLKRQKQSLKLLYYIVCVLFLGLGIVFKSNVVESIAKVNALQFAKPPESWLFVNVVNNRLENRYNVKVNQLGLRWIKRCNRADCLRIFSKLQDNDLSIVLASVPTKNSGLCRIELGPYANTYQVFSGLERLFSLGFYGKVSIISWLGL